MKRILFFSFILIFSTLAYAADEQFEFVAAVTNVTPEGDDGAVLTMSLVTGFDITVRVTSETEIKDDNEDPLTVADLEIGLVLEVEGIFTDGAILAREIEVTDDERDFEIRGMIEAIGDREITVHGFMIMVPLDAEIKDAAGNPLDFSDLKVDQLVKVEGSVDETLIASEVKVRISEEPTTRVRFEGIVLEVVNPPEGSDDLPFILVQIEGDATAKVQIRAETEIKGDLAVGVLVRVIGTLADDLSVNARRIIVKRLLQLSPDELEMRLNQTRRVEVILRSPRDADVELTLTVDPLDLVELSTNTVMIPAGKITGFFEVTSGATAGEALITVTTPEGLAITLEVEVEDREERREEELEIEWRPDEIRLATGGTQSVRLVLNQPSSVELMVQLTLKEGVPGSVEFPATVTFGVGEIRKVVDITAGSDPSDDEIKIRATLPDDVDHDDLEVEIRGEQREEREELEIRWEPDEIEAEVNQELSADLVLDRPAPSAFSAILTIEEGSDVVELLTGDVQFEKDSTSATVRMTTRGPGKAKIKAALPFRLGGDETDLVVEVGEVED
ncbi:DUF5666 domain-containing protein [Acidobacteria bacterium AH-259-D05]|nr:DUF5666 domain-containing protein [Acidobacteria bacterium AH-259-D05]